MQISLLKLVHFAPMEPSAAKLLLFSCDSSSHLCITDGFTGDTGTQYTVLRFSDFHQSGSVRHLNLGIVCSVITHINSSLLVYLGLYRVPMTKLQCIIWIYFTIQLDVKPCFMNQQHHMTTFEAQYKLGTIPSSLGVPYNIIQMFIKLPYFGSSTGPGDVIFPLHGREPGPQPRWARPRAAARDARGLRVLPLRAARAGGEGGHGSARWGVKVGETLPGSKDQNVFGMFDYSSYIHKSFIAAYIYNYNYD